MRLIDEYGVSDVPYEHTTLLIDDGCILAQLPDSSKILMAEYSSIEKAKRAMKKLHIAYIESKGECFMFPSEERLL